MYLYAPGPGLYEFWFNGYRYEVPIFQFGDLGLILVPISKGLYVPAPGLYNYYFEFTFLWLVPIPYYGAFLPIIIFG